MKLNKKQLNGLLRNLDTKWTNSKKCPICNSEEWNFSDRLFTMEEFSPKKDDAQRLLMLVLTCKTCGYTNLFNGFMLGLKNK